MLNELILPLVLMAISGAIALVLTPMVRKWMTALGAVDQPDARRVNRVPIPRGGGLAVIAAFFITLGVAYFGFHDALTQTRFFSILPWFLGASLVLGVAGFIDDLRGIPALLKLAAQLLAAGILCYGGARLMLPSAWGAWTTSPWIYVPLTLAWYVGIVNAFNLIDGLDGLSSGLAIIATVGLVGVTMVVDASVMPLLAFIFIGAVIGFLRYNYHPATIFLGDTGSLFIGLFLATAALVTHREDAFMLTMGLSVLCIGMPLIDTSLAILRRTLRYVLRRVEGDETQGGIMVADRSHIHHRLLSWAKGNQRLAVWGLYAMAIALVGVGFLSTCFRLSQVTVFLIGFIAFATVIIRAMSDVELWDTGRLFTRPGARNGSRRLTVPAYVLADVVVMIALFALLRWVTLSDLANLTTQEWLQLLVWYAVPVILGLVLVKAYTRIWGRSTRKDSFLLIAAVGLGSLVSHLLVAYALPGLAPQMMLFHMAWALLLPLPLLFVRLIKTAFLQWLVAAENHRLAKRSLTDASIARVLFYGAGMNLRAYITLCEVNVTRNNEALLGILDDNLGLRGRIYRDLPILGPLEVLEDEACFASLRPTKMVVTTPTICDQRLEEIRTFCRQHNMTLTRCVLTENEIAL